MCLLQCQREIKVYHSVVFYMKRLGWLTRDMVDFKKPTIRRRTWQFADFKSKGSSRIPSLCNSNNFEHESRYSEKQRIKAMRHLLDLTIELKFNHSHLRFKISNGTNSYYT